MEDFYRSLRMEALITPFAEVDLPRIAQLVVKTNQFNLTARRHGEARLRALAADPACVHLSLRLRDRLTDHGLVGVMIALDVDGALDIDTWLLSCRVIGRTVEAAMFSRLCSEAEARGLELLRGTYVRTPGNGLVRDLYERLGFALVDRDEDVSTWTYRIADGHPRNEFIDTESWIEAP
jgi:FkbH-like protein